MQTHDPQPVLALLENTRTALLSGDFQELSNLTLALEAALSEIGSMQGESLQAIRESAAENDRLLSAAAKGVRAAQRRAKDLTDQGRFSTYDIGGQRNQPGLAASSKARRV